MFMLSFDISNFAGKVNDYLERIKYDTNMSSYKSTVNNFIKFYESKQKPIEEYTKDDFKEFLEKFCANANAHFPSKSRLMTLFETTGYYDVTKNLKSVSVSEIQKPYIKSFEELDAKIEGYRIAKFPFMKNIPEINFCDSLTAGQVALYLAWLGVPQRYLSQMPLAAINLDENLIDAGRKFSFADNQKMIKVFTTYKNSDTYKTISPRQKKGELSLRVERYYGDKIIRTKTQAQSEKSNTNSINTIISHLSSTFKFDANYLNIVRAGQFSRGYEKFLNGISPDFSSSEKIWEYFNAIVETEAQTYTFKADWENYLSWRKETD